MNFRMEKKDLFPILSQIQGILEKRSAFPVFAQVLIKSTGEKQIQLLASDAELSFSAKIPAIVSKQGMVAINGKKLFEIVRELSSGEFSIEEFKDNKGEDNKEESKKGEDKKGESKKGGDTGVAEKETSERETEEGGLEAAEEETELRKGPEATQILLRQGKSWFKIHGSDPKDFPAFPPVTKKKKHRFLVDDFLNMIDRTLYCSALDESRYHLTGVFVEHIKDQLIRFVATDGHRLSFMESKVENAKELQGGIIIPKKGLQEIRKMLAHSESEKDRLDFYIERPRIVVKFKNQLISVRLIEGEYPNYKSLLPSDTREKMVFVSVKPFLDALRRISVLTSARFKGVNFTFEDHQISMDFEHPDVGSAEEQISCEYKGEKLRIRFNSRYIMDVLQSFNEDQELRISLEDENSSGIIQAKDNPAYTCIVMPMQI